LKVDGFSGHISDRLGGSGTTSHNGKCFSTHDKDNDVSQEHNCAMQFQGKLIKLNLFVQKFNHITQRMLSNF